MHRQAIGGYDIGKADNRSFYLHAKVVESAETFYSVTVVRMRVGDMQLGR